MNWYQRIKNPDYFLYHPQFFVLNRIFALAVDLATVVVDFFIVVLLIHFVQTLLL